MRRIIKCLSVISVLLICPFVKGNITHVLNMYAYYNAIEQDSTQANLLRYFYAEIDKKYYSLQEVNISELKDLRHTIRSSSSTSKFLVTPAIGDQYDYNTCTGWAICYAAASIRLYEEWLDMDSALCSPQYLYNHHNYPLDPTLPLDCRNSYSDINIIGNALESEGTCSYNLMPYDTTNCTSSITLERQVDAMNRKFDIRGIGTVNNVALFKNILDHGTPIVVDMFVYDSFLQMWVSPTANGMWMDVDTTLHNQWRHAVCIVGYDDTKSALKVMNSWGTDGGDNGFFWATYNVVQKGCFKRGIVIKDKLNDTIEGPEYLSDSAWYYIHNVPTGATITWSITNNTSNPRYTLASAQGRDSMYVANRRTSLNPWNPLSIDNESPDGIIPPPGLTHKGTLSVTITCGSNTYTAQKAIREPSSSLSMMPQLTGSADEQILNLQLHEADELLRSEQACTLELWHSIYGRMRTQVVHNSNEQMIIDGLPKGVYVVVLRQSGRPITQTKVIIN